MQDTMFSNMSFEEWQQSTQPKVQGSWNLHTSLPGNMDFFIFLSSISGILGNIGQSNYAAGNTFEDAFARYRHSRGEKATSIDLGVVLGKGFLAENEDIRDRLLRLDVLRPNTLDELFALLSLYCDPNWTPPFRWSSQIITGVELPANILARGLDLPTVMRSPMFRQMHQLGATCAKSPGSSNQLQTLKAAFVAAESLVEASSIVAQALKTKLSRMLGIKAEQINSDRQLASYGMDSLVGVELRNWLSKELESELAVFEILGGVTLRDLAKAVALKSTIKRASLKNQ